MDTQRTDNLIGRVREAVRRASQARDDSEIVQILDQIEAEIRECVNAERLAAATQLAGWLAHRINNPLGAISGNAQLLARRIERDGAAGDPEAYMRYIEAIQVQTERSAQITGELLEFTRPTDVVMQSVDIALTIQDAVDLARYGRGSCQVALDTEAIADLPPVKTDKDRLVRAIYEITLNGIQAAGENGTVMIKAEAGSDWLKITVADNGCGIAPEALHRAFDPFFSTREKARGLGLTTSLSMVRQIGGTVDISDTGPSGSAVTIHLPAGRDGR